MMSLVPMTKRFLEEPFERNPVLQFAAVNYLMAEERQKPTRIFAIWSAPTVASRCPLGLKATPVTGPPCPFSARGSWTGRPSQIRAVRSLLPVARRWPSGLKATQNTQLVCLLRERSSRPLSASQTLTDLSSLMVARR